jgi:mono/diheme cytochrome c family protein
MRTVIAAVCLLLALSVVAQDNGERLYERKCSTCHGTDGRGETSIGKKFGVRDLRSAVNSMTDEQVENVVVNGRGQMPANRKLDEEQVGAITKYLHVLVNRDKVTANAVAVEKLYLEKCSGCHARDGAGNVALGRMLKVPDITSAAVKEQSDEQLRNVIAKGKGKMPGFARKCTQAQMEALATYVKSLSEAGSKASKVTASKSESKTAMAKGAATAPARKQNEPSGATPTAKPPLEPRDAKTSTLLNEAGSPQPGRKPDAKLTAEPKSKTPLTSARAKPTGIQQTYVAKCAACHSSDGSGQGTIGRSMNIRSFSSAEVQRKSNEELADVISSGRGKMPAYAGKLTSEQIAQLAAYIRMLGAK